MTRRSQILLALLIPCLAFAAWQWLRPYAWHPDPGARGEIRFARVERDHSFFWLDVHVEITSDEGHDLSKPFHLVIADGRQLSTADVTLEGSDAQPIEAVTFRFWLEEHEVAGPLHLQLNDGRLVVREKATIPDLAHAESRFHRTSNW